MTVNMYVLKTSVSVSSVLHLFTPLAKCGCTNICLLPLLQENVVALINCVVKNVGFSHGKPVAAFTIYKCLLHWKSFEAERTSVFDRLIQMIGSEIEVKENRRTAVNML